MYTATFRFVSFCNRRYESSFQFKYIIIQYNCYRQALLITHIHHASVIDQWLCEFLADTEVFFAFSLDERK